MGRAWRGCMAAMAAAVALGACDGKPAKPAPGEPQAASAPRPLQRLAEFDPCAAPDAVVQPLCQGAEVAKTAAELGRAMAQQAAKLSPEGARLLAQDEAAWLKAEFQLCQASIGPDLTLGTCLGRALGERLRDADQAAVQMGGYTFQRAESHAAIPIPAAQLVELSVGEGAPRAVVRHLAWPRIDSPVTPATQRFNELARRPDPAADELMDNTIDYTIAFAGPALISVRFNTYNYAPGAAHPNGGTEALNVLMASGRPLEAGDVFRGNTGWEDFLTAKAAAGLAKVFADYGEPPAQNLIRDAVTKPRLWIISRDGLSLLFPPYALGGPYALGEQEVQVPWVELRPYLRPDAPAPFQST